MAKNPHAEFYNIVSAIAPNANAIRTPHVPGRLDTVFFADMPGLTRVYKFNQPGLAAKNMMVSRIFNEHAIPCPHIISAPYKNQWYEAYNLIPGQTLYEYIGGGMDAKKIRLIFMDAVREFAKMDAISLKTEKLRPEWNICDVAKKNLVQTNGKIVGEFFAGLVKLLNIGKRCDRGLYHCGITPKNIIVSDDGNFAGFVDLDEAGIADKHYAFSVIAAKWQLLGMPLNELLDFYTDECGGQINRRRVSVMANANNLGRNMLWRHAVKTK